MVGRLGTGVYLVRRGLTVAGIGEMRVREIAQRESERDKVREIESTERE